jgi:tRNA-dihydrouridine synthase
MVGRGIFHSPWIFNPAMQMITVADRVALLKKHIALFERTWGTTKNYNILKRFYKIYLSEFPGASSIRNELMNSIGFSAAYAILDRVKAEQYQEI